MTITLEKATHTESVSGMDSSTDPRVVAFFDLDGTLIKGSANIPFALAAFRTGFVTPRELAKDLLHNASFIMKGASDERSAQVRDRILGAVAGREAAAVEGLTVHFIDGLVAQMRAAMLPVLREHADAGHARIVLSASPTEIVSAFATAAGLEEGIGTTAERAGGRYTGVLSGPFCYKEGKAEIMAELASARGYDLSECYAYSDSASDLPMLRAVGHPVAVNPEAELRRIAEAEGWPIIETSRLPRFELASVHPKSLLRLPSRVWRQVMATV